MTRLERFCESLVNDILQAYDADEVSEGSFSAARAVAVARVRAFVVGILDDRDTEGLIAHKLDQRAGSAMDDHPLGRG